MAAASVEEEGTDEEDKTNARGALQAAVGRWEALIEGSLGEECAALEEGNPATGCTECPLAFLPDLTERDRR